MRIAIINDPELTLQPTRKTQVINAFHSLVANSIADALIQLNNQVEIIEMGANLESYLRKVKPDFVFNTSIKKMYGSTVAFTPSVLEKLQIPFTGPSASACTNIYNKFNAAKILKNAGVPVPKAFNVIREIGQIIPEDIRFPIFIKPLKGGCSRGVINDSLIKTRKEFLGKFSSILNATSSALIGEEFLPGREFSIAVLGNETLKVFPLIEFSFKNKNIRFRTYSQKMIDYETETTICPATLSSEKKTAIEGLAKIAYKALDCRDFARIDIRMDGQGKPCVLEVNAIPNLEPKTSSFALMAKAAGLNFVDLIKEILDTALERDSVERNIDRKGFKVSGI